jgi:hypothetical protein
MGPPVLAQLLNLPVHTIHHIFPRRSFPLATPVPDSPTMPMPYAVSAVLAFLPPIWFRLMHAPLDKAIEKLRLRAQKHGARASARPVSLVGTSWAAAPRDGGGLSRQLSGGLSPQLESLKDTVPSLVPPPLQHSSSSHSSGFLRSYGSMSKLLGSLSGMVPPALQRSSSGHASSSTGSPTIGSGRSPSRRPSLRRGDSARLVRQLSGQLTLTPPAAGASSAEAEGAPNCVVIDEDGHAIGVQLDAFGEGSLDLELDVSVEEEEEEELEEELVRRLSVVSDNRSRRASVDASRRGSCRIDASTMPTLLEAETFNQVLETKKEK